MSMSLPCPRCHAPLEVVALGEVQIDHCFGCGGTLIEPGEAANTIGVHAETSTWLNTGASAYRGPVEMACPRDGQQLHLWSVQSGPRHVDVDVCQHCHAMWLDRGECDQLRSIVMAAGQDREAFTWGAEKSSETVRGYLFRLLTGMPGEVWNPVHRRPIVNGSLLVLLCVLFAAELWAIVTVANEPGALSGWVPFEGLWLVPEQLHGGNNVHTIVSYIFLHASLIHLFSNVWFQYLFGDNVEDYLGHKRFLGLYLLSGVAGGVVHAIVPGDASIPLVGASGAIAGLLGAYLLYFRGIRLRVVWFFVPLRIPAELFIGLWVVLQVAMIFEGTVNVSWQAHLGGFAAGLALAHVWRRKPVTGLQIAR